MFVHAYQSWLWNETAKIFLEKKLRNIKTIEYSAGTLCFPTQKEDFILENIDIPIIGFDIEERNEEVNRVLADIMKKENVTERDFLIKQMPEITAAGGRRNLLTDCKELMIKEIDKETIELSFSLGKGSYATMIVKQLFS